MISERPRVSIVIPVKNGEDTLRQCLKSIRMQSVFNQTETIVIDSGSEDGTRKVLDEFPFVKILEIRPEAFNHGETRNMGIRESAGEFVLMTVQDAYADSSTWIEKMLNYFDNPQVAAVIGQQAVPHKKGLNPHRWYRPVSKPKVETIHFSSPEMYLGLAGGRKDSSIRYDNVNTMYRKIWLEKYPFQKVEFGEDIIWMHEAAINGLMTVYDPAISVWHYHHLTYQYTFSLTFKLIYYKFKLFNFVEDHQYTLRDFLAIVYRNIRFRAKPKWIIHNWRILKARRDAQQMFEKYLSQGVIALDKYYRNFQNYHFQGSVK